MMDKELIERLAREAGYDVDYDGQLTLYGVSHSGRRLDHRDALERFAALVRADALEEAASIIQAELDHAAINEHRLPPAFGKRQGEPAVRAGNIEAALVAIRKLIQG